jgi:hypothetical protein
MTTDDLGVPSISSTFSLPDCGPVCAQMVLTHFGLLFTRDEILQRLPIASYGVDIINLGIFLSQSGLHMRLFFDREIFGSLSVTYNRLLAEFIESGGEIEWQSIEYPRVEDAIVHRHLVILLIPKDLSPSVGHYVVAHRINETGLVYNDPAKTTIQREATRTLMYQSKKRGGLGLIAGPPRQAHDISSRLTA